MLKPLEPIPFAPAGPVVAGALEAARMAEPMTVAETALRYVKLDNPGGGVSGPWTFDRAPYLRRPMECLTADSGYWLIAVMGMSQSGKSVTGDIWQGHCAVVDPADIITVWPDKDIARSYITSQIDKMIGLWPELKAKQFKNSSADNIFSKQFAGSNWFHVWPVPSQLRARPVPRFRVEDYDVIPEDIGGEGGVIMLLTGRQTTFEGYEIGYVNSAPARGRHRGIEALVASGTNESWFVDCLHCGAPFDFAWERMYFDADGTADDARDSVVIVCPDCGGIHEPATKRALMDSGRWVGAGQTAVTGGVAGELTPNRIASFRYLGPMGFASWPRLAELQRGAEIAFEDTQDEAELKAFFQSRWGVNYVSRAAGADPVTAEDLAARAEASDYSLGEVPPGVLCLTAAVDVQGNRFEVMVQGWGVGFESWVIDRFAILALDDGQTAIDPARHPEHWGVLLKKVFWRKYCVQGADAADVPILSVAIDTGGVDGVTDNAFAFWYTALRAGIPRKAITLLKGGNKPAARLLPAATRDSTRKRGRHDPDSELFVPNVHRFKDMVDVRLRRADAGPAYIHWPADIDAKYLDEATAEVKESGLWVRLKGRANETWDQLVYNAVVVTRLGGADSSMRWVPRSARPAGAAVSPPASTPAPPPIPARSSTFQRRGL